MKRILISVATAAVTLFAACSVFKPAEEYREQSGHTVYRVPGGSAAELPTPTPAPQKIPGESRRASGSSDN